MRGLLWFSLRRGSDKSLGKVHTLEDTARKDPIRTASGYQYSRHVDAGTQARYRC